MQRGNALIRGRTLMKSERIDIEQARHASGLRIVTLAYVPSPWGEALKGILHIKQLPHARVGHVFGSPTQTLLEWTAQDSFPVMAWNDERPRTTWIEQLYLAERLAPDAAANSGAPRRSHPDVRLLQRAMRRERHRMDREAARSA